MPTPMASSPTRKPVSLIRPERLPHAALRRSELYLKRQTFAVERAAVLRLQALYRAAYHDLLAAVEAARGQRSTAERLIAQRVDSLKRDVLNALRVAVSAVLAGSYLGRLWQLRMVTRPEVTVHMPPLTSALGSVRLYGHVQDPFTDAWAAQVSTEVDDLTVQARRALGIGYAAGALLDFAQRLRVIMGIGTQAGGYRANFNRVQTLARTLVQTAANDGTVTAYRVNPQVVDEVRWLTAEDERVCPRCRELDGKRFPVNTDFRPPLHPQCRCTLTPTVRADALVSAEAVLWVSLPHWGAQQGMTQELAGFIGVTR